MLLDRIDDKVLAEFKEKYGSQADFQPEQYEIY